MTTFPFLDYDMHWLLNNLTQWHLAWNYIHSRRMLCYIWANQLICHAWEKSSAILGVFLTAWFVSVILQATSTCPIGHCSICVYSLFHFCKHMTETNMAGWFTVQSVWPRLFTDHNHPIKYKPVAHGYHYCFKVFTLKLPYSRKLSREKTFANWWKISFLRRKLLLIACLCCAKECYAPRFCGENFRE